MFPIARSHRSSCCCIWYVSTSTESPNFAPIAGPPINISGTDSPVAARRTNWRMASVRPGTGRYRRCEYIAFGLLAPPQHSFCANSPVGEHCRVYLFRSGGRVSLFEDLWNDPGNKRNDHISSQKRNHVSLQTVCNCLSRSY